MMINKKNPFLSIFTVCLVLLVMQSCGEDNRFTGPDYSEVPPPFDTTEAISDSTTPDGLKIYTIAEGYGNPERVMIRDQVQVYYTGRTDDGKIFDSTYRNGITSPGILRNLTTQPIPSQTGRTVSPLIEGFRLGLIGMAEGEKRTIVIPPHLGYGGAQEGRSGYNLRNDTLIFDVELEEIL